MDRDTKYLDQYFTEKTKIGSGAYGIVYKAKSKQNNQYYAIKVCRVKETNQNYDTSKNFDIPYTSLREVCVLR